MVEGNGEVAWFGHFQHVPINICLMAVLAEESVLLVEPQDSYGKNQSRSFTTTPTRLKAVINFDALLYLLDGYLREVAPPFVAVIIRQAFELINRFCRDIFCQICFVQSTPVRIDCL